MKLPTTFPVGTLFGDADSIPVSCEPGRICMAWNGDVPRFYPLSSFDRAALMYESQFRRWVDGGQRSPYHPSVKPGRATTPKTA